MQTRLETIASMEDRYDRIRAAVDEGFQVLKTLRQLQQDRQLLFAYYGSNDWFDDRDLWDKGSLPPSLRCGVLSEDAVYDLLADHQALMQQMQALAASEG